MASKLDNLLQAVDALIRAGNGKEAKRLLRTAREIKVHDSQRRLLAAVARRLNFPTLALRALFPLVRPTGRKTSRPATDAEKAEYSASLIRLGSTQEALDLLQTLNPEGNPEVLLFECFAYFSQWNYRATIPLLEQYNKAADLTDYQRLIGRANLATALNYERDPRAELQVAELEEASRKGGHQLLHINALMMRTEAAVDAHAWTKARAAIAEAEALVSQAETLESLFVKKWKVIVELYAHPKSPSAIRGIDDIRSEAIRVGHWETLRNCDYHQAVATQNPQLYFKVFFGTPYSSLRERLAHDYENPPAIPECFDWSLSPESTKPIELLTLPSLKPGQNLHRAMGILLGDFYRPVRVAAFHSQLFPGTFFNPNSSPGQVHQLVRRLKIWMKARRLPVKIRVRLGTYALTAFGPCTIRVPLEQRSGRRQDLLMEALLKLLGSRPFTAREAAQALDMNLWAAIRLLSRGVEEGQLQRSGKANQTRYTFTSSAGSKRYAVPFRT